MCWAPFFENIAARWRVLLAECIRGVWVLEAKIPTLLMRIDSYFFFFASLERRLTQRL